MARIPWRPIVLGVAVLSTLSCNAFKRTAGPDEAPFPNPPGTASVTVEYDQVPECVEGSPRCADNVVFFGDRKSTRLNSSHLRQSRMPSSA